MTQSIVILSEKGLEWSISPSGRKKKKWGETEKQRRGWRERERENERKYWVSASDICSRGHNNKTPSRSASHHICSHNASASKAQINMCLRALVWTENALMSTEAAHGFHIYLRAILISSSHINSSHLESLAHSGQFDFSFRDRTKLRRGFCHSSKLDLLHVPHAHLIPPHARFINVALNIHIYCLHTICNVFNSPNRGKCCVVL